MSGTYRKKPVEVKAIRWVGDDTYELDRFCGKNWTRADAVDKHMHDEEGVVVWNTEEAQWLNVPIGHWIIRGVNGELYPCSPEVFESTYEEVDT